MKRIRQCGGQVLEDQWQFGWAMHQVLGGEYLLFGIFLLVISFILQIQASNTCLSAKGWFNLFTITLPSCSVITHTSCDVVGFRV
jgi:hypothetical protein